MIAIKNFSAVLSVSFWWSTSDTEIFLNTHAHTLSMPELAPIRAARAQP